MGEMNDLEQMAIERLKAASDMSLMAYQQPLVICISGGKDSGVITELAIRSGIPCEFLHNHTTADAPETGTFVGWKKGRDGELIKLLILEDAFRSSATTRKCRCSKAIVLDIRNELGYWANINQARSEHDYDFVYKKGEMVSVPNFDFDRWKECAAGIHFFITAREAMKY